MPLKTQSEQSAVSSDTMLEARRQEARSVGTSVDIESVAKINGVENLEDKGAIMATAITEAAENECAKTKWKEMAIVTT